MTANGTNENIGIDDLKGYFAPVRKRSGHRYEVEEGV
jgi:hypothetical protein